MLPLLLLLLLPGWAQFSSVAAHIFMAFQAHGVSVQSSRGQLKSCAGKKGAARQGWALRCF